MERNGKCKKEVISRMGMLDELKDIIIWGRSEKNITEWR